MIRKTVPSKRVIDLDGQDGNAYVLLGMASSMCKQIKIDPKPILDEMQSGNYSNLVKTFDKYFGDIFILETKNKKLLKSLK